MLHYSSIGSGPSIVLIHGFCENSTCFNEQVFLLKASHQVICIDLPGHGSSAEQRGFTIDDIARQVNDVLDVCGVTECVMIGHSMGGYVVLSYAKQFSNRLKGFGLLHSTANADSEERKTKRDQAIRLIEQRGAAFYVEQFIPPLFAEGTSTELIQARQSANAQISSTTLITCLTAMKNRLDGHALLQNTKLPVVFIAGGKDVIIPMDDMFAQAASVAVAQVTALPECAHMGMLENPKAVSDSMKSFAEFCYRIN